MIDKDLLRKKMLSLTQAELTQTQAHFDGFLESAKVDGEETIDRDEQAQAKTAANLATAFDDREQQIDQKLHALSEIDFGPKTEVAPGAVVRFGERYLVIGVSTAEFEFDGKKLVGISPAAPIYKAIEGRQRGDECKFRGRKMLIHSVI